PSPFCLISLFFLFCYSYTSLPPRALLFPYTTLFRSRIFHICPETNGSGKIFPHSFVFPHTFLTLIDKWHQSVFLDLVFSVQTKLDRKSTRLNSSHVSISYAVFCLKQKINSLMNYNQL